MERVVNSVAGNGKVNLKQFQSHSEPGMIECVDMNQDGSTSCLSPKLGIVSTETGNRDSRAFNFDPYMCVFHRGDCS